MQQKHLLPAMAVIAMFAIAPAIAQDDGAPTLRNHHADPDSNINTSNVGQLEQAWSFQTEHPICHVPLVSNGRVFFGDWGGTVYALKGETGEAVWQQHLAEPMTKWPWHGFAGTGAVGGGMLFEASTEGQHGFR